MDITIRAVAHHRNGVGGNSFSVVLFEDHATAPARLKVGVVFDGPDDANPERFTGDCAVLDVALLAAGDIGFGSNSWRGDVYEPDLRRAAVAWNEARAAGRHDA